MVKKILFSILSLISLSSCTFYFNLQDYFADDDLAYYHVSYLDDNGKWQTIQAVDFELIDKDTVRVYTFSDDPEYFNYYIINKPFEIITTF